MKRSQGKDNFVVIFSKCGTTRFSFVLHLKLKSLLKASNLITFAYLSARLSLSGLFGGRKVRTAQGNTPANGRVSNLVGEQQVPQKITALINHRGKGENVR